MLRRVLLLPLSARPWVDLTYLTLGLLSGCVTFTLLFVGPVTGLILLITLIGIPILYADFFVVRWYANLDRRRGALAGVPIALSRRRWEGRTLWRRLLAALGDPMTWRELAWFVLLFGLGLGCFLAATIAWFTALGILVGPLWMWSIPDGVDWGILTIDTTWEALAAAVVVGIPLTVLAAWIVRGSAALQAVLARALLDPSAEARIEELEASRAGAVDAAAVELRRIERDLHDGAQARLVALAMDLGMAREQMGSDPDAAAALLAGAHEDAKTALAELRDLARGIHPAILTDRGLDAAISALAARCPVPCTVDADVPRLPAAVESAAYFTVAEALANVAKHSGAQRCEIAAHADGRRLVVEVRDDGVGGADAARGTGLAGLRGRVEAQDGRLVVTSPPGEGTVLRAELPCAS